MPADFLPLIGNGAGDWLCGRVDADGRLYQIVHWYHGGGDWIPWGNDLSEAILFDAVLPWLPGPQRRHALEAEQRRPQSDAAEPSDRAWLHWALSKVSADLSDRIVATIRHEPTGMTTRHRQDLADAMIEQGVAEVAVRCELVQNAGDDWRLIETHCGAIVQRNSNLAWPWEWLGLAKHHLGRADQAEIAWRAAATCSAFTDQSIRLRSDFDSEQQAKFSIALLLRHGRSPAGDSGGGVDPGSADRDAYIQTLINSDAGNVRRRVYDHWTSLADESLAGGDPAGAVAHLMSAGWDLGAQPISIYGDLLRRIEEVCESAGQRGRAAVAGVHADCFRRRFS